MPEAKKGSRGKVGKGFYTVRRMDMKTSRQRQAEATKQKITNAGVALIEEKGYDAVTIEDITAASGISIGTFYHYFESKDAFYYSYVSSMYHSVDESLEDHVDLPLLENLRLYVANWFREIKNSSPEYLARWLSHAADKEYHLKVNQVQDVSGLHRLAIESCLEAYVEKGELTQEAPIAELAEMIVTILYGIDVRYCMTNGTIDLDYWADRIVELAEMTLDPYVR